MTLKQAAQELRELLKKDDELDNPQHVWDWESLESHCQDLVNKAQALLTALEAAEVGEVEWQQFGNRFMLETLWERNLKGTKGTLYFSPTEQSDEK